MTCPPVVSQVGSYQPCQFIISSAVSHTFLVMPLVEYRLLSFIIRKPILSLVDEMSSFPEYNHGERGTFV